MWLLFYLLLLVVIYLFFDSQYSSLQSPFILTYFVSLCLSSTNICATSDYSAELEWLQCHGELVATHW